MADLATTLPPIIIRTDTLAITQDIIVPYITLPIDTITEIELTTLEGLIGVDDSIEQDTDPIDASTTGVRTTDVITDQDIVIADIVGNR